MRARVSGLVPAPLAEGAGQPRRHLVRVRVRLKLRVTVRVRLRLRLGLRLRVRVRAHLRVDLVELDGLLGDEVVAGAWEIQGDTGRCMEM